MLDEFQGLRVGDFIPDGPLATRCGFVVRDIQTATRLVLQSTTHLPLSWRVQGRARISWTWTFVLAPAQGGLRHLAVNALSHGTLFDDALPYDSKAWALPFVVAAPEVATN